MAGAIAIMARATTITTKGTTVGVGAIGVTGGTTIFDRRPHRFGWVRDTQGGTGSFRAAVAA